MHAIKKAVSEDGRIIELVGMPRAAPRERAPSASSAVAAPPPSGQIDWRTQPEGHLAKPRGGGKFYIPALNLLVIEM